MPNTEQKKNWTPSPESFRKFLEWLGGADDSDGRGYLQMRERLAAYFDRKNVSAPDELADETLNRAARRLEEEGAIETETPAKFCYTQARFVFLEYLRGRKMMFHSTNWRKNRRTKTFQTMKRKKRKSGSIVWKNASANWTRKRAK